MSLLPPVDGNEPGYGAAALAFAVGLWKTFFRLKADRRRDQEEGSTHRARETEIQGFERRIRALNGLVEDLSVKIDVELTLRRKAEHREARLQIKVDRLVSEVQRLGGNVYIGDLGDDTISDIEG